MKLRIKNKRLYLFIIVSLIEIFSVHFLVYGEELDYSDIQKVIEESDLSHEFSYEKEVEEVMENGQIDYKRYFTRIIEELRIRLKSKRDIMIKILIVTVVTAIFTNLANVMENAYVAQTGFTIVYMILMSLMISSFTNVYEIANKAIEVEKSFIQVIVPTYTTATIIGTGFNTATVFVELTFLIIGIIEWGFMRIILPLINIYMIFNIVNNIHIGSRIDRLTELIRIIVKHGIRIAIVVVTGLGTVQRMIAPTSDATSRRVIASGLKLTPFIGKSIDAVGDTALGAGILIKNAIGTVSIVMIIIMCIIPMINIFIYIFTYELSMVIAQPIADERVVNCIKGASDSSKLLLEVIGAGALLFIISIALLTN